MTIKAYKVEAGWGDKCCVVFATNNATARREGAQDMDISWEEVESCRRAQEFDQYAPGPIPPMAYIENGWWWECFNCGRRVSEDMADEIENDGLNPDDFTPTPDGQRIYCCHACLMQDWHSKRANENARANLIEVVESKFPGCQITTIHVHGKRLKPTPTGHGVNAKADFKFPGGTSWATWIFGDDKCFVHRDDEATFKALYGK